MFVSLSVAAGVPSGRCLSQNGHRFCSATLNLSASVEIVAGYLLRELPTSCNRNDSMRDRPICRRDAGYVFTVGSTGDSPVPSGDPPDGTEHGIEGNNAVFSHSSYTTTPPGESPGGAGGSPAPPSVNRDSGPRQHSWWKGSGMLQTTSTERRAAGGDRPRSGGSVMRPYCGQAGE
jgi:hypothetical protein